MARKTINLIREAAITGSALRHTLDELERPRVVVDTAHEARCNEVLLCEVSRLPRLRFDPATHTGIESVRRDDGGYIYTSEALRGGLVVITVGNRYAPRGMIGGLFNPVTGKRNGTIAGGQTVSDLIGMNIAGFENYSSEGEERTKLRVIGTILDSAGRPLRLRPAKLALSSRAKRPRVRTLVVTGNGMESGKTTVCIALAKELRARGVAVSFEKKTGSACVRDMMRVALGRHEIFHHDGHEVRSSDARLPVADFVDVVGSVGDSCGPVRSFVNRSLNRGARWQAATGAAVHIVELADNLAHGPNLALLADPRFRASLGHFIYVPDISFDAADHAVRRIRSMPGLGKIPLALSGPLASDGAWTGLREEIAVRLRVACIRSRDSAGKPDGVSLADWVGSS